MSWFWASVGVVMIAIILIDGFESMVLPRRVSKRWRPARLFYRITWRPWSAAGGRMLPGRRREAFLSIFGPLSTLLLLTFWALGLVSAFGILHWSTGSLSTGTRAPDLLGYLYFSGVTFFTLGFGDLTPGQPAGRALAVAEAGIGFGFLAVVIGYLPVLYQAFSHREHTISMLDARAGSPPAAARFLLRLARDGRPEALESYLKEWERWCAELLESHLSFPVLSYYRSQHDNQSWLAALTFILDASAFVIAGLDEVQPFQAQMTFAMARHAAVDIALVFGTPPRSDTAERVPAAQLADLCRGLAGQNLKIRSEQDVIDKMAELRAMYEPFISALSAHFLLLLPPLTASGDSVDNWQTSAWMRRVPGIGKLVQLGRRDDHFD